VPIEFPPSIIDKKQLQDNEGYVASLTKVNRYTSSIVEVDNMGQAMNTIKISVNLLRPYNSGRHGNWDNYCEFKNANKGSYVKSRKTAVTAELG